MAIDAGIYSQIRQPEAPNLLAMYGQAQQLQGMQQQNRLAELAFQDRERGIADAATQREAVKGFGADTTANYNRLLQTGNLSAAQGYQKSLHENQAKQAETQQKGVETAGKVMDNYRSAVGSVQTPEQARQVIAAGFNDPTIGPVFQQLGKGKTLEQAMREVPDDPAEFQRWQAQAAIGAQKLAEFVRVQNVNTGGQTITQSVQPATGQVTQLGTMQNTISPDAQLSAETSTANNIRSSNATTAIAEATRDAANITKQGAKEEGLRKEFAALPEVKNLKEAIPAYQAIVKAAAINNPQADINLVYGLAKLYDPASVVREGEYATIANSQAIPEWIKGMAQRLVGGGRLTPDTKKQILEQAQIRFNSYQSEVDGARQGYDQIAQRGGLDPQNVFVPIGQQVASPAATPAAPGGVRKYNPATGKIE
jgi:hypothetical protein